MKHSKLSRSLAFLVVGVGLIIGKLDAAELTEQQTPQTTETLRPNFVVFFMDDMGWGDLSSFGNEFIHTPNIDSIGEDGMTMSQWYSGSNVCTPSRASLLTGRYAPRSGTQFVVHPYHDWGLPPSEVTIAEMLKSAGYATGMVGKWHLGNRLRFWPTNQGFDSFLGVPYSNDMTPFDLFRNTELIEEQVDQRTLTGRYADEAVHFIREHANAPFFLYYAETFPHRPLYFPARNIGRSGAASDYGDTIETVDDAVGRVLATLEEAGVADNTVVIFTSDNGPWFQGSTGPWRGRKGETHEGGYRVPFLVRWPAAIPKGSHNSNMAMSIDILPTFARLAGANPPADRVIDGLDITDMWLFGSDTPHSELYFIDGNDVAAVRSGRYKLVLKEFYRQAALDLRSYSGPKLFDMQADPFERYDVANRHPEEFSRLLELAEKMSSEIAPMAVRRIPASEIAPGTPRGPVLDGS